MEIFEGKGFLGYVDLQFPGPTDAKKVGSIGDGEFAAGLIGFGEVELAAKEVGLDNGYFGVGKEGPLAEPDVDAVLPDPLLLDGQDVLQVVLQVDIVLNQAFVVLLVSSDYALHSRLLGDGLEQHGCSYWFFQHRRRWVASRCFRFLLLS